ncbi:MAG: ribokinase, partial [Geminicoccaceae bacterium]
MLLVFGSLNADMLFEVEALPRPGETVLCPGYQLAAGGKGANQAAAAAKAGGDVRMIGHLGGDSFGDFTRNVMLQAGVNCDGIDKSKRATAIAVIGVDRNAENQIIVASGANLDTHPDQVSSSFFGAGATVLCQNEIREDATFELLRRAKAGGARTMLNLAPATALDSSRASHLDILVVNEIEAAMASGRETIGEDAAAFAADLARTLDLTAVITLGAEGAVAAGPDGRIRSSSLAIEPVDTTGAGDAFVGVLAATLDRGEDLRSALQWASVGAGLACTGLG